MSSYVPAFQPKVSVSQAEKDELLAYARLVQTQDGLYLSHLRKPGSTQSLQSVEAIANALVADGKLSTKRVQGGRANGGYLLYFVTGG